MSIPVESKSKRMALPITSKLMEKELKQEYILPEMAGIVSEYSPCLVPTSGGIYCGLGGAEGENKENPFSYPAEDKKATVSCANECRLEYCIPWINYVFSNMPETIWFVFPGRGAESRNVRDVSFSFQEQVENGKFFNAISRDRGNVWHTKFTDWKEEKDLPRESISNIICEKFNELKENKLYITFHIKLDSPVTPEIKEGKGVIPTIVFPKFPRGFFSLNWELPNVTFNKLMAGRSANIDSINARLELPGQTE